MEAVMEKPIQVIVPCPSCARPMSSVNDSWQCLACHPTPANIPMCKTQICKRPLTKLGEPWNCWICLKCNKHPEDVNKATAAAAKEKARPLLDVRMTEERVQTLIDAAVAAALKSKDYPPTRAEIKTMTDPEIINAKPETVMQKAKRIGVRTHNEGTGGRRTTADIMADIEAVEKTPAITEVSANEKVETIAEANDFREAAQQEPGADDEYARGLKKEDMV